MSEKEKKKIGSTEPARRVCLCSDRVTAAKTSIFFGKKCENRGADLKRTS